MACFTWITSPDGVQLERVTNVLGVLQRFLTGPLGFLLTEIQSGFECIPWVCL